MDTTGAGDCFCGTFAAQMAIAAETTAQSGNGSCNFVAAAGKFEPLHDRS